MVEFITNGHGPLPKDLSEQELGIRNDTDEHNLLVASWIDDLGRG